MMVHSMQINVQELTCMHMHIIASHSGLQQGGTAVSGCHRVPCAVLEGPHAGASHLGFVPLDSQGTACWGSRLCFGEGEWEGMEGCSLLERSLGQGGEGGRREGGGRLVGGWVVLREKLASTGCALCCA